MESSVAGLGRVSLLGILSIDIAGEIEERRIKDRDPPRSDYLHIDDYGASYCTIVQGDAVVRAYYLWYARLDLIVFRTVHSVHRNLG